MTASWIPQYGAPELKLTYNRNLAVALIVSIGGHLALIGLYLLVTSVVTDRSSGRTGGPTVLGPAPRSGNADHKDQSSGGGRPPMRVVSPVMTDSIISVTRVRPDAPVPTTTVVDPAMRNLTPQVDTSLGSGWGPPNGPPGAPHIGNDPDTSTKVPHVTSVVRDAPTSEPVFMAVEREPTFDQGDLTARIVYPDLARRNGLTGDVVLEVYVDRMGVPLKTVVDRSSNIIFVEPAQKAVMSIRFTPATQNGTPVGVWVQVPVSFQLN